MSTLKHVLINFSLTPETKLPGTQAEAQQHSQRQGIVAKQITKVSSA